MNGLLATLNPFNLALASAMTAGSATTHELSSHSALVAANSVSAAPAEGGVPTGVPRATPPALVGTSKSACENDTNENLQSLQSTAPTGSLSCGREGERRSSFGLQNMHEGEKAGQSHKIEDEISPIGETAGPRSGKGCCSLRQDIKADPLSGLQYSDSGEIPGCSSSGLFETPGSDLALPILPRGGTSNLETGGLNAVGSETCGSTESRHAKQTRPSFDGPSGNGSVATTAGVASRPQDSIIQPTPQAPNPGVETRRGKRITASPAAFSFQPDFEKRFNEIMGTV